VATTIVNRTSLAARRALRKNDLKRELYKIQKINHKQYNKLYESVGKAYADFYIFAIYCLTPVEHNEEFEELYRELSNNEQ
jgi:hypothetical protein